jgi:hypothetical protein
MRRVAFAGLARWVVCFVVLAACGTPGAVTGSLALFEPEVSGPPAAAGGETLGRAVGAIGAEETAQPIDPRTALEASVCALPERLLRRTAHGYRAGRSGDLQILTQEPDYLGHGGFPHSGPWDYVADVPLLWYGPGYVRARGAVERPVTLADVAPTQAELLGFDFDAPDGEPLREALAPAADAPPKLLVVVVWDGAGRDVLAAHPDAWPNLRSLIGQGTYYDHAEVGSSPPSTAQIHATIGTGAFSREHGIVAMRFRVGDKLVDPWHDGPRYLELPTLADRYDRATGNEPLVAAIGTVAIHLGMLGHGARFPGGDADLAVLRDISRVASEGSSAIRWRLPEQLRDLFRFPAYVNDLPPLSGYLGELDRMDGRLDDHWRDHDMAGPETLAAFQTPARIPFQTRMVEEIVRREGFGADDVPDLLFVNYKLIDEIGHLYSMNSPEMGDAIRAQDGDLPELIGFLNGSVGIGNWAMALTADHGHTPNPAVSGATVISPGRVADAIEARLDRDGDRRKIVESVQPTQIYLDVDELHQQGVTLTDVSRFVLTLTKRDVGSDAWPIPAGALDDPAFLAAYPSAWLDELACVPRD